MPTPQNSQPISTSLITPFSLDVSRKFRASINNKLIDKLQPMDPKCMSHGFEECELTISELAESIKLGWAFSYVFKDGHRKSDRFLSADLICVDMDGTREIGETLDDPIVSSFCSLWYTTPSHSPDYHRFRLVFVLPKTEFDIDRLRAGARSLSRRLSGDLSATDGARMFYGSSDSEPEILGNMLSEAFLEELIDDGAFEPQSRRYNEELHTSNRSRQKLALNDYVRTSDDRHVRLADITVQTSVHCHFHHDTNASAFVAFNDAGEMYHHCSSCQLTRWANPGNDRINFNDFEDLVVSLGNRQVTEVRDLPDPNSLEALIRGEDEDTVVFDHITVQDNRYLKITDIHDGLTLIKSPKGSGKTTFLSSYVQDFTLRYPSFKEFEESTWDNKNLQFYRKDVKVLLIGHRQALIGDLCNRLGLNNYLDESYCGKFDTSKTRDRFGVCLDSLWRVKDQTYDLVIIDEVEQVLAHFLSNTIGEKRCRIFEYFADLLRRSRQIIALDADLGWTTYNTLREILETADDERRRKVYVHVNTDRALDREIKVIPSVGHILSDIKDSVLLGKRIFVSSNSKVKIDKIAEMIKDLERECAIDISMLSVTSDNSRTDEVQEFVTNVRQMASQYQVILSSPSLGTGVDISFEDDAQVFDAVYGIYFGQVNTHFDIDQQLSRVRNPGEIKVCLIPEKFRFETDLGLIEADYRTHLMNQLPTRSFDLKRSDGLTDFDIMVRLLARVEGTARHSMNDLKRNFIEHKESQGFQVTWIDTDKVARKDGNARIKDATHGLNLERIDAILSAQPFDLYDYTRCCDHLNRLQYHLSPELMLRYHRTSMEIFLQQDLDEERVKEYGFGELRRAVNLFSCLSSPREVRQTIAAFRLCCSKHNLRMSLKCVEDRAARAVLLYELLSKTPFFSKGEFSTDAEFSVHDLSAFALFSENVSEYTLKQLSVKTQKDVRDKPVQHLGKLLKLIGLSHKVSRRDRTGSSEVKFYRLDPVQLARIEELVALNKQMVDDTNDELIQCYGKGWRYMNEKYGFKYSQNQLSWLLSGQMIDGEFLSRRIDFDSHHQWMRSVGLGDNTPDVFKESTNLLFDIPSTGGGDFLSEAA